MESSVVATKHVRIMHVELNLQPISVALLCILCNSHRCVILFPSDLKCSLFKNIQNKQRLRNADHPLHN